MQGRMTFVAAFYTFTIELNHSDRNIFTNFRVKVPRHELESREHFYARMIAYLHAYKTGIEFTQKVSDPKQPTIVLTDEIGSVMQWIDVGAPEKRKLELSLKQNPSAEHRIYFYTADDVSQFCHHLRGSKTNWIETVSFYTIEAALIEQLITSETTSPHWIVSFIDDHLYISANDIELESDLHQIDIWQEFQSSLTEDGTSTSSVHSE